MRSAPLLAFLLLSLPAAAEDVTSTGAQAAVTLKEPKPADLRADMLDRLFGQLHSSGVQSNDVQTRIWQLWMSSDSATADVLLRQATGAMEAGDNAPALQLLDELVEAYPAYAEAWNKRATLYFALGRFDDSLADIDKVLALEPRHFGALAGRGMILARQKKYDRAMDSFREALAVNPQMEDVKAAIKQIDKLWRPI